MRGVSLSSERGHWDQSSTLPYLRRRCDNLGVLAVDEKIANELKHIVLSRRMRRLAVAKTLKIVLHIQNCAT